MVPVFTLLSRCLHVTCAMLLFFITLAPLFSPPAPLTPQEGSSDAAINLPPRGSIVLHFAGNTIVAQPGKLSMIIVAVMMVTGLFNAHQLKVGTSMAHSGQDRLRWRMNVYFLKTALMLSMSPLLEFSIDRFSAGAANLSEDDKRQTAALTRAYVVLLLAGVGSYCKVFREDSIAKHQKAVQEPPSPPKDASAQPRVSTAAKKQE